MNANYVNPVLRQLRDQQVRFAPRDQQLEQANRAERLLTEIDPGRVYPYEYLCFRITDFRPDVVCQHEADAANRPATICGCSSKTCPTPPTCRPTGPAKRC